MAISDNKKVQTAINRVGQEIQLMRDGMDKINATIVLFQAANPDVTGTALEGNVTVLNNALSSLETELNLSIFTQLIAKIVKSHRGEAL